MFFLNTLLPFYAKRVFSTIKKCLWQKNTFYIKSLFYQIKFLLKYFFSHQFSHKWMEFKKKTAEKSKIKLPLFWIKSIRNRALNDTHACDRNTIWATLDWSWSWMIIKILSPSMRSAKNTHAFSVYVFINIFGIFVQFFQTSLYECVRCLI